MPQLMQHRSSLFVRLIATGLCLFLLLTTILLLPSGQALAQGQPLVQGQVLDKLDASWKIDCSYWDFDPSGEDAPFFYQWGDYFNTQYNALCDGWFKWTMTKKGSKASFFASMSPTDTKYSRCDIAVFIPDNHAGIPHAWYKIANSSRRSSGLFDNYGPFNQEPIYSKWLVIATNVNTESKPILLKLSIDDEPGWYVSAASRAIRCYPSPTDVIIE